MEHSFPIMCSDCNTALGYSKTRVGESVCIECFQNRSGEKIAKPLVIIEQQQKRKATEIEEPKTIYWEDEFNKTVQDTHDIFFGDDAPTSNTEWEQRQPYKPIEYDDNIEEIIVDEEENELIEINEPATQRKRVRENYYNKRPWQARRKNYNYQ